MKFVYICSPCRGRLEQNIRKANDYCWFAAQKGVVPFAPHTAFTGFLDDTVLEQRQLGMKLGLEILKVCDEIWVFGSLSEGMKIEVEMARELNLPIRYFNEQCEEDDHE